jgi:hypothetical protein
MRFTTVSSALILAMVMGTPAFAQSFVGKWTATAKIPNGDSSEVITVTKVGKGYLITGKPAVPPPPGVTVSNGVDIVIDGDHFSYKRTVTVPGGVIVFIYSGVVSGDTFSGTAEVNGTKIPYVGVRIKG